MGTADSVALRRRLRVELRRARRSAGMTQKDIADRLDWSPSKIIRIESGQVAVTIPDLRALLNEYGVTERGLATDLEEMARGSKKQPWSEYRGILSPVTIQLYGYEAVASRTRNFQLIVLPGLLQTEEYAREILPKVFHVPEDRAARIVEARLERQELLDHPDAPQMDFLIDEAAIRRVVGSPKIMEAQLQRISELARSHPKVTVQIVPFPAGAHPGMEGPLTHLEFPDPDDDDVVYIEGRHGVEAVFHDDPAVTADYLSTFLELEHIASRPDELDAYLGRAIERLPTTDPSGGLDT
jgi:transcriptional regulator with XRE-family HTH domain